MVKAAVMNTWESLKAFLLKTTKTIEMIPPNNYFLKKEKKKWYSCKYKLVNSYVIRFQTFFPGWNFLQPRQTVLHYVGICSWLVGVTAGNHSEVRGKLCCSRWSISAMGAGQEVVVSVLRICCPVLYILP